MPSICSFFSFIT